MTGPVKRRYDASGRRERAAATRAAILDAAGRRFERDGYVQTTMAAVAADAGVALKTVYLAFETKAGLLRAVWNARLRGSEDAAPMTRHPMYVAVLEEPDPARALELNARNSRLGKQRIGALTEVIRAAAPLDADVAALWDRINTEYRANQRAVVARLSGLRLDVERATDVLWAINHPSTWHLLVGVRGWTPEEYERWTAETAVAQLLAQADMQR